MAKRVEFSGNHGVYAFNEFNELARGRAGFFGILRFGNQIEKLETNTSKSSAPTPVKQASRAHPSSLNEAGLADTIAPSTQLVIKELLPGKDQTLSYIAPMQCSHSFLATQCTTIRCAVSHRADANEKITKDHVILLRALNGSVIAATRNPTTGFLQALNLQQCVDVYGFPADELHWSEENLYKEKKMKKSLSKKEQEMPEKEEEEEKKVEEERKSKLLFSVAAQIQGMSEDEDNNEEEEEDDESDSCSMSAESDEIMISSSSTDESNNNISSNDSPLEDSNNNTSSNSISDDDEDDDEDDEDDDAFWMLPLPTSWVAFLHQRSLVRKEIVALSLIPEHPNLIKMIDCGEVVRGQQLRIFVVLPYYSRGDLMDLLNSAKATEQTAMCYFVQLASGLKALHDAGFCHRDVKLDNILVSDDLQTVVIGDFGFCSDTRSLSSSSGEERPNHNKVGSFLIRAPEIWESGDDLSRMIDGRKTTLLKKGYSGAKADMWSLGIVLFNLLTTADFWCFHGKTDSWSRMKYAIDCDATFQVLKRKTARLPPAVTPAAESMIISLLSIDPMARPTPAEMIDRAMSIIQASLSSSTPAQTMKIISRTVACANAVGCGETKNNDNCKPSNDAQRIGFDVANDIINKMFAITNGVRNFYNA